MGWSHRLRNALKQCVARVRYTNKLFVTATDVGVRLLGEPPKSSFDLGWLKPPLDRQVQCLSVLPLVEFLAVGSAPPSTFVQPLLRCTAAFEGFPTQLHLIVLPSLARHDDTSSEGDPTVCLELVEAERTHHVEWSIQPGTSAARSYLDPANRRHGEDSGRAVPDDPLLFIRRPRAVMHKLSLGASQSRDRKLTEGLHRSESTRNSQH